MNKFCGKCGKELNNGVCPICNKKQTKIPGKGMGIASMILGIISVLDVIFSVFLFLILLANGDYIELAAKIALGFIFLFTPFITLIIGFILGIISKSKAKNGFNIAGIILSIISFILCLTCILILALI